VTFPGHIDDVHALLRRSDLLVHHRPVETFGLSLVEAAIEHVPVVCLGGGALSEMVPTYAPGVVVGDDTPRAFAAGIVDAVRLGDDRSRLTRRPDPARSFARAVVIARWHRELDELPRRLVHT